jgi:GntR family transcriptional regulator/MocR family aminotransferase
MNDMSHPVAQVPLYRQIYERVRASIDEGRLQSGDRLPSARAYAQELGVARGTVDLAYSILAGEGYVEARGRTGTRVAGGIARRAAARENKPTEQPFNLAAAAHRRSMLPLAPGVPAYDLFPRKLWTQLVRRHARTLGRPELAYPDPQGMARLREALAAYLSVSRGVICSADEVIVTGGFQSAIGLVTQALLGHGDAAWIEDPGYTPIARALTHIGARAAMIPVDEDGIDVVAGIDAAPDARLAIVAPAHQFPMGVTLSLPRRLRLLDWAERAGSWILEDDFDGEFRYQGRPHPALKSLDRAGRVFYTGTFSKTLFPGLRLGYLVVPPSQLDRFRQAMRFLDGGRSALEQAVTAEFLSEGHFARHIKRMRGAYRSRRAAMVQALAERFGTGVRIEQGAGGLHLLLRFREGLGRIEMMPWYGETALGALPMRALSERADLRDALMVGFANVPERQAPAIAAQLHAILQAERAATAP